MTPALPRQSLAGGRENRALLVAGAAHLLLFGVLSVGWQAARDPLPMAEETVPVEFVTIADAPRVTEAPRPSREAAPQETAVPDPAPEPEPTPEPTPPEDAVPLPEAKPVPPLPKKAETKAAPTRKPLDMATLTDVIDKSLPKARQKPLDTSRLADSITAAAPKSARVDPRAAATLAQAIQAQVAPCWNPPIGGRDVRKMTVVIRADYGRDGRLLGAPSVVGQTGATAANQDYARAFAETARRAVLRCQPLELPANLYDLWKSVEINFDPESMA